MLCHLCHAEPGLVETCGTCGGTGRATVLRLCDEPWHEVAAGLWQGGHDLRVPSPGACVVREEFDLVVSLTSRPGYGPAPGVEHKVVRLADAAVDGATADRVRLLAADVADRVAAGRRVLVRCSGGLNRSGLVVAAALVHSGRTPDGAIAAVRSARGPWALTNPVFVAWLRGLEPGPLRAREGPGAGPGVSP